MRILFLNYVNYNYRLFNDNVLAVDQGIQRVVQLVESHFADSRTAYVFTADHGMTDAGNNCCVEFAMMFVFLTDFFKLRCKNAYINILFSVLSKILLVVDLFYIFMYNI